MKAILIDCCDYSDDGIIERMDGMEKNVKTSKAEVVESGLRGWGRANAVVTVDGSTFLAVI